MENATLVVKCKFCGYPCMNGHEHSEDDPVLEVDFHAGEIRYICKKCKKDNAMRLAPVDTKRLPGIGLSRF